MVNAELKIFDEKLAQLPPQVAKLWQTLRTLGVFVLGIFWIGDHSQIASGTPIAMCPKGTNLLIAGCDMLTAQDGAYHLEVNLTEGR